MSRVFCNFNFMNKKYRTPLYEAKIKSGYFTIHNRLIRKNGTASYCSSVDCQQKKSKRFEWALIKGKTYSNNIEDYMPLCVPCHKKYDFNPETLKKLSLAKKGKHIGKDHCGAKTILHTKTGVVYDTVSEAAKSAGLKLSTLSAMLSGQNPNKTSLIYAQ